MGILNWVVKGSKVEPAKKFKLSADEIKPIAVGFGGCLASDYITVEGCQVGFMYRGSPDNDLDSGWRFLSGHEDDAYMANAANHAVYDINTIANYDPEITPFLDHPQGSVFERPSRSQPFVRVTDWVPPAD